MWLLSPFTQRVLEYAAIGAGIGTLRWVFSRKEYPEKDPETPESTAAKALCRICRHPQAFHQQKDGAATQECSSCLWSLTNKSVSYTALHNFEPWVAK